MWCAKADPRAQRLDDLAKQRNLLLAQLHAHRKAADCQSELLAEVERCLRDPSAPEDVQARYERRLLTLGQRRAIREGLHFECEVQLQEIQKEIEEASGFLTTVEESEVLDFASEIPEASPRRLEPGDQRRLGAKLDCQASPRCQRSSNAGGAACTSRPARVRRTLRRARGSAIKSVISLVPSPFAKLMRGSGIRADSGATRGSTL